MKLTYKQMKEAKELYDSGLKLWQVSAIFSVSDATMRRYLRAYERYGKSFWSTYPQEINN